MLKITRETDYAMLLMCEMASQHALNDPSKPYSVNASQLSEQTNITISMVSKLLKLLAKAGVLSSTRGPNGGYQLLKSIDQINAADIICAIEGPVAINNCATADYLCDRSQDCHLVPHWVKINQTVFNALSNVLLSDLILPLAPEYMVSIQKIIRK